MMVSSSMSEYNLNQKLLPRSDSSFSFRESGKFRDSPSCTELTDLSKKFMSFTLWKTKQLYKLRW